MQMVAFNSIFDGVYWGGGGGGGTVYWGVSYVELGDCREGGWGLTKGGWGSGGEERLAGERIGEIIIGKKSG